MIHTTHTEDFVKEMYTRIGITEPQQLSFKQIAKALGIEVFYWQRTSQALFLEETPFIFLSESISKQQQWQDFCHELAHVLLHSGHQGCMSPLFREYQENKANNFMYHACMPTFMLNQIDIRDYTQQTTVHLSELFHVEYEFALKRLKQYIHNKEFMRNQNGMRY